MTGCWQCVRSTRADREQKLVVVEGIFKCGKKNRMNWVDDALVAELDCTHHPRVIGANLSQSELQAIRSSQAQSGMARQCLGAISCTDYSI
jgi:hypothetical protein